MLLTQIHGSSKMKKFISKYYILLFELTCFFFPVSLLAQTGELRLLDWQPKSQLAVKETKIIKPKFPVIDIHNHLRELDSMNNYLAQMDSAGVLKCVSLDGFSANDFYKKHLEVSQKVSKDRLIVFFNPDFSKIDEPGFGQKEAEKLEKAVAMGVRGIKIFKSLGLTIKDKSGKIVPVDDPRIDPIWAKCGELGIPVLIHVSDPRAFFTPIDRFNERYDELASHPDWSFYGSQYPTNQEILTQRNHVIARHPNTIFIGAHIGSSAEDLDSVAAWFEKYPNFYVDLSARISELGRQPYTARKFMIKFQDRIRTHLRMPTHTEFTIVFWRQMMNTLTRHPAIIYRDAG